MRCFVPLALKVPLLAKRAGEDFLEGLEKAMVGAVAGGRCRSSLCVEAFMDAGMFVFRVISCLSFFLYLLKF